MEVIVMSNIGIEVLKIALIGAVEKQQLITAELEQMPEQSNVRKLVAEQTHLLEETLTLLNRIG
jgi:hypothetical protein